MIRTQYKHAAGHERYIELCALSTSGDLNGTEWEELRRHLDVCSQCSERMQQYGAVFTSGMTSLFGGSVQAVDSPEIAWSPAGTKRALLAKASAGAHKIAPAIFASRFQPAFVYSMLLLTAILGIGAGFRWGHYQAIKTQTPVTLITASTPPGEVTRLTAERDALNQKLDSQAQTIDQLSGAAKQQSHEVAQLKELQKSTRDRYEVLASQEQKEAGQLTILHDERDKLASTLEQTSNSLREVQDELATARSQHQQDQLRSASLEREITEAKARETQVSRTVDEQQQYLASDRDIRELMGARNLYIVDVFDVDKKGQMKNAFGRIFYTKEKSLIFYAFDLDQQRGVRNAAFQAWGRKSTGQDVPLNMGIFYLDNEANRRWVLKFDNPEKLEQIDSVFVTVEPKGGSRHPSGKQLLYASLRTRPNHP
jgi:hypothetical protein